MLKTRPLNRPMLRSLALALAVGNLPARAATTQPSDLPVKAVTLYTSGVGFFRHDGSVSGDGTVTLKFKTQQINDVLKSLVIQDAGGKVSGVQYPSQDPLDKTLKTFQIDLTGDPSMARVLSQLRGATVTISMAGDNRHGTVVGVEERTVPATLTAPERKTAILNIFDGKGLSQVELEKVQSIQLDDERLQAELGRALAAVAAGRDQDKKPVTIAFTGPADHRLALGYVVETPVWKTTYRLLLDGPGGAKEGAKAGGALQGWAVVENQTDSDWNDITLSLVSGRPISFVMDLYQPIYLPRPTVQLDLFAGLKPPVYRSGTQNMAFRSANRAAGLQGAVPMEAAAAPAAKAAFDASDSILVPSGGSDFGVGNESISTAATTAKLGELFQYKIEHVSLARQQSSLVPIVTDKIEAEPLSIFNQTVLPRNPLNGVMLTNTTGKLLPQGPITVLSGGAYAGDSRIEDLPGGQKRLLSFGIDLETLIDVKDSGTSDLIGGKIVKGVLFLSRKLSQTKTYSIENKSDHDRGVIVEHELLQGWALVDSPEPMEKTDVRYRFKLAVAKGKTETLKVTQQKTHNESVMILNNDVSTLVYQSKQGAIPQKVRDALIDAIKRRQAVVDLLRQSKEKGEAIDTISQEQARLRENMRVVDKGTPYHTRLLNKLNDQESQIETLRKERDDIDAKAKQSQADFEAYLDGLNVE
ncbi:MAG: hypothetical protein JWM57_1504 [Phycisphaerales bacterium]|nr:hypothetical protein [Phycisphaerales bacterium]